MDPRSAARPATVDAILEATRRVIAGRGRGTFTLSAVATAAGVSRPTLYRWFSTKDDLLDAFAIYEQDRFAVRLRAVVDAQATPARRLDAAVRCLVTYLDDLMGPDPIGADPAFALASLAESLQPQTAVFVRVLGDSLEAVPAVRLHRMSRRAASEMFLRVAYSHYFVPHPEPEVLLSNLRHFVGLTVRSARR